MEGGKIVVRNNGTELQSIYGATFPDEGVWLPHSHAGLLSMVSKGANTNGAEFRILFAEARDSFDGTCTVFGRVIHGF